MVFSRVRPASHDVIFFRDGSRLAGTIVNESFKLTTAYHEIRLNRKDLAGICRGNESDDLETVITNSKDQFSGFLQLEYIRFRPNTEEDTIPIRRERIAKVIFKSTPNQPLKDETFACVALKSGDYFRAQVSLIGDLVLNSPSSIAIDQGELATLIFPKQSNPSARAFLKSGDLIQGSLMTEDVKLTFRSGTSCTIHAERIDAIDFTRGDKLDLLDLGRIQTIELTDPSDQYEWSLSLNRIQVGSIPRDSDYFGLLENRDSIVAIDGIPYMQVPRRSYRGNSGRMSPMRAELMDGVRDQIIITVRRNGELLLFRLIRAESAH